MYSHQAYFISLKPVLGYTTKHAVEMQKKTGYRKTIPCFIKLGLE